MPQKLFHCLLCHSGQVYTKTELGRHQRQKHRPKNHIIPQKAVHKEGNSANNEDIDQAYVLDTIESVAEKSNEDIPILPTETIPPLENISTLR